MKMNQKKSLNSLLNWIKTSKEAFNDDMTIRDKSEDALVKVVSKAEHEKDLASVRKTVFSYTKNDKLKKMDVLYRIMAIVFALFFSTVLVLTVSNMPPTGELSNPANNEVASRYLASGLKETGATNVVAGMILDYRAFDTLGESHVLFVAAITVTILLRLDKKKRDPRIQRLLRQLKRLKKRMQFLNPRMTAFFRLLHAFLFL